MIECCGKGKIFRKWEQRTLFLELWKFLELWNSVELWSCFFSSIVEKNLMMEDGVWGRAALACSDPHPEILCDLFPGSEEGYNSA